LLKVTTPRNNETVLSTAPRSDLSTSTLQFFRSTFLKPELTDILPPYPINNVSVVRIAKWRMGVRSTLFTDSLPLSTVPDFSPPATIYKYFSNLSH